MMQIKNEIPFSIPHVPADALTNIQIALQSVIQQGDGLFSRLVEQHINSIYPDYESFLTPSCTSALEMAMMLIDICPGDEIIVPSFTFTSIVTAITKFGGIPVFADIDVTSGCIDVAQIEEKISSRTRAISWVNYAGLGFNLNDLRNMGVRNGIFLIEDAAHNFGVLTHSQQERPTGDFVAFSFHATKNIQCGEGGALLVKNPELLEKAHVIREKGTNRWAFNQKKVSKYSWVGKGSSYLLAEINSALLLTQLQNFYSIQEDRRKSMSAYKRELSNLPEFGWTALDGTERSSHMFALLAPNKNSRDLAIEHLNAKGIGAVSHYEDLASSPAGFKFSRHPAKTMTNSISFSQRILRLPLYVGIGEQVERVTSEFKNYLRENIKTNT